MKIAIAAEAPDVDTEIAAHAARAAYYLIFNPDGRLQAALANPAAASGQGAGPAAAQFLAGQGVELVAAGEFGPRFLDVLEVRGIKSVQVTGRATDVVARLIAQRKA